MPKGDSLGELEQITLLALLRLGPEAYGVTIRNEIRERTGRSITPGTIYPTLRRLENKGFVESRVGPPTSERGGRSKRHYRLLPEGVAALRAAWKTLTALADGCEALLESES